MKEAMSQISKVGLVNNDSLQKLKLKPSGKTKVSLATALGNTWFVAFTYLVNDFKKKTQFKAHSLV